MAGARFRVHSAIVVEVDAIEKIVAPSYRFYADETTELRQAQAAMQRYGVQPAAREAP